MRNVCNIMLAIATQHPCSVLKQLCNSLPGCWPHALHVEAFGTQSMAQSFNRPVATRMRVPMVICFFLTKKMHASHVVMRKMSTLKTIVQNMASTGPVHSTHLCDTVPTRIYRKQWKHISVRDNCGFMKEYAGKLASRKQDRVCT